MEGLQGSGLRAKGLGLGVQGLRVQVDLVRGVGSCFLWVDDWVSFFVRLMGVLTQVPAEAAQSSHRP